MGRRVPRGGSAHAHDLARQGIRELLPRTRARRMCSRLPLPSAPPPKNAASVTFLRTPTPPSIPFYRHASTRRTSTRLSRAYPSFSPHVGRFSSSPDRHTQLDSGVSADACVRVHARPSIWLATLPSATLARPATTTHPRPTPMHDGLLRVLLPTCCLLLGSLAACCAVRCALCAVRCALCALLSRMQASWRYSPSSRRRAAEPKPSSA
jgi:hypothetical protein